MDDARAPRSCLRVRDLTVRYGTTTALDAVTFDIFPGEVVAVVGPNGAGKSSLFKAVAGLVDHTGEVTMPARPRHHRRHRLGAAFIPQRTEIDLRFPISVDQVVRTGRRPFAGLGGRLSRADRAAAAEAMTRVGLAGYGNRTIGELSGGELQRVLLARSLAQEADVVLLDESLASLDPLRSLDLLEVLADLARSGTAVLLATHDLALARHRFARCLAVNRRIVADGPPRLVLDPAGLDATFGSGAGVWQGGPTPSAQVPA